MKKVELKFKRIEVLRAFPRDNSVEIRLTVNDGKEKVFAKSVKLDNTAEIADVLIQDVRNKIKADNKCSAQSDDILSGVLVVKMCDDDDFLIEKIAKFLTGVREKFRLANSGRMSYYDIESQIKKNFVEF